MLAMNYGCQSGSNIIHAVNTFKKLGYKNILVFPYRTDLAFSEMIQRRPIYVRGCGRSKGTKECHAWILDGFVRKRQEVKFYYKCKEWDFYKCYTYYNDIELVHNNLGWGGYSDGWYEIGLFGNGLAQFHHNNQILINFQ